MQITLTEIIVALIGLAGILGGGWWKFTSDMQRMRHESQTAQRKAALEEMATNTTARLELEKLLMARIDQLQAHIAALEARITTKDARIAELERRVDELEREKDQWELERAQLKGELARLCAERHMGKAE